MRHVAELGIALLLAVWFPSVAMGHDSTIDSGVGWELRHVGVVASQSASASLSGGWIAFEGPELSAPWPGISPILLHEISSGRTLTTSQWGEILCFDYPYLFLLLAEVWHGDLDGDGFEDGLVLGAYNIASQSTTIVGGVPVIGWSLDCSSTGRLIYVRYEYDYVSPVDYNGDGDVFDHVVFTYDILNRSEVMLGAALNPYGVQVNGRRALWFCDLGGYPDLCWQDLISGASGRAGIITRYPGAWPGAMAVEGDIAAFSLAEAAFDIDGDGQMSQTFLALADLATGALDVRTEVGNILAGPIALSHGVVLVTLYADRTRTVSFDLAGGTAETHSPGIDNYPLRFHRGVQIGFPHGIPQFPEAPPLWYPLLGYDFATRTSFLTGLQTSDSDPRLGVAAFDGDTLVVMGTERTIEEDLDGDGSRRDPVVIYLTTVSAPLRVSIAADVTEGEAPLAVVFISRTMGGAPRFRYLWDFGDGSTSDLPAVMHTFAAPGTYRVGLSVTDAASNSTSKELVIQVNPRPIVLDRCVITPPDLSVLEGTIIPLTVQAFSGSEEILGLPTTWSAIGAVTVDPDGTLTVLGAGEATITAKVSSAGEDTVCTARFTVTPLGLSITAPASQASVSGVILVTGEVSANATVQVRLGSGAFQEAEVSGTSWVYRLDTTGQPNGHLRIQARGVNGVRFTSQKLDVVVANPPPPPPATVDPVVLVLALVLVVLLIALLWRWKSGSGPPSRRT